MSYILHGYTSHKSAKEGNNVARTLECIIDAAPHSFDNGTRKDLIECILDDVHACGAADAKSRLTKQNVPQALLAIKTLARVPQGGAVLATAENMSTLLTIAQSFRDDVPALNETLKCTANTMLLVDTARATWIGSGVGGGGFTIELLDQATDPEQIFLACRILFLCTVSSLIAGPFIKTVVEDQHAGKSIIDIIGAKTDLLVPAYATGTKMTKEALTDLMNFLFNLLSHYPKVRPPDRAKQKRLRKLSTWSPLSQIAESESLVSPETKKDDKKVLGDYWSDRLDGILPPLLRAFHGVSPSPPGPLVSPLTNVIHALIGVPFTPALRPTWFPSSRASSSKGSPTSSSRSGSPTSGTPKPGPLDRAMSAISSAGRRSFSAVRGASPTASSKRGDDTLKRALDLLEGAFAYYMPGAVDPDDAAVRERAGTDASALDDAASPLVLLVQRLVAADEGTRKRVSERLFPADLDRSAEAGPLEGRPDTLGRCLRLLACVHHPRLRDATGEMLYFICDQDAGVLASQVGYGNVAGFLYHKGVMAAPPRPGGAAAGPASAGDMPINPITGIAQRAPAPDDDEMTEEEKEAEAERLMSLFDRLERTGAIQPSQNPVRQAIQRMNE